MQNWRTEKKIKQLARKTKQRQNANATRQANRADRMIRRDAMLRSIK